MKILYGANFRVGQTGEFLAIALERMGIDLVPFTPSGDAPDGWLTVDPQVDAVELFRAEAADADLFLMVESSTGQPFLPRNIPDLPIPTAYWLYDNYLNFRWNKEVAALFDHVYFAQQYRMRQAHAYGRTNVHWLPFAADEVFHRNFHCDRDIDIGYVGSITGQKKRYFADLEKAGLTVTTNDRYLSYDEIGRFYSRCKVVYNILARRDMNVRTFEAPAAGAVVVNQRWIDEGVHDIFKEGESMLFHSFRDAPSIIRRILADDAERERIGANGERIVMAGHTYRHRAQRIIDAAAVGVTDGRVARNRSFVIPVAEGLTCLHRDFGWFGRAQAAMKTAFRRSFGGTVRALLRFGWWRIKEKVEKTIWSFGVAPV
ncbi:MAG: glycosyltransferase [Nitrospinae bacterium]|nr:glycosyltransferase [Nitrospinota bacterium]